MPTVLTIRSTRVVIYSNDHPPPHVHAVKGNEARARFALNGPEGPVELMDHQGYKLAEIREIGEAIAAVLPEICAKWEEIHGSV